ncbi:hypothetical protein FAEPRAA2165_01143 [Faecalibacterium duncaniae]|uniref:Uncharacterized protein n=1 Tax=Faecalibacterium duncaniae (strain DSM 17677 / JCM 31915 / A2-165) TaxID=411483 RepID=C7H4D0_FAED2|nr:hypothetical protein FAEPRAA2165_01143 [Faecalibacterium duncaniae]
MVNSNGTASLLLYPSLYSNIMTNFYQKMLEYFLGEFVQF